MKKNLKSGQIPAWISYLLAFSVVLLGGIFFVKWLDGSVAELLKEKVTGRVMGFNMSFCITITGISLFIASKRNLLDRLAVPVFILSLIILAVGVIALAEYLTGVDSGINDLLLYTMHDRMGLPGSVSLVLSGSGLIFLVLGKPKYSFYTGIIILILSLAPSLSYILNMDLFQGSSVILYISWPTTISFISAGLCLMLISDGPRVIEIIMGKKMGDVILRRLMPAIIIVPLFLGFIYNNSKYLKYYDHDISLGFLIITIIILITLLAFWTRNTINKLDGIRIANERSIREREKMYRTIVETTSEGIWQSDANFKTVYVNNKMAEMLDCTVDEMEGRSIFDFMDEEGIRAINRRLNSPGQIQRKQYEMRLLRKDGTTVITLVKTTKMFDNDGAYTGSIGLVTDITQRKNVEKDLTRVQRKLKIALENGKIGTWEWNIRTNELMLDERTEKMFGLKTGTFGGTYEAMEQLINEEDISHFRKAINRAINESKTFETIYRIKPRKGESGYISSKALLMRDRKGMPLSLSGVCFDVTDLKKNAEQSLIKLNEDLLRSNSDLQQFAYVASHDLQEPLRMVSSFTQLLQQRYRDKLGEDGNEYINFAVEGSKRMYELLNGLLTYSRIQTKGKEFRDVDMNTVMNKVIANLSLYIEERHADIRVANLPVLQADESQMIQLMQNLIENGMKFSPGIPRITVSATQENGYYQFSVSDDGIGIDKQYHERIFRIFQRLHNKTEYPGTGIGLAICRRILDRHRGTIWVKSTPGEGSTFNFTIPENIF